MKKYHTVLIILFLIGLAVTTAIAAQSNLMSIQIREGHLRSKPSFLGKILAVLEYGDRVEALEQKDRWLKVQSIEKKKIGWIHDSALTTKKIILHSGQADVAKAASSDELALAGKGFNQEVEREYNAKHPELDYTWINKMESMVVSQDQIMHFLIEGGLTRQGVVR